MFRIDGPGATNDNKFTEGDPANGTRATVVTDAWLNAVQEEIAGAIEGDGQELEKANSGQLSKVFGRRVLYVGSVAEDFAGRAVVEGQQISPSGYHVGSDRGGSPFVGRTAIVKSSHNGGTIISPTVPAISAQAGATLAERTENFLNGVGETDSEGTGVFVRTAEIVIDTYFGVVNDGDGSGGGTDNGAMLEAFIANAEATGALTILTPATKRCDRELVIDSETVYIVGIGFESVIDFTNLGAGLWGLTLGVSGPCNGSTLGHFRLAGNSSANGFRINGAATPSSINVARCDFFPIALFGWDTGLRTTYCTTTRFETLWVNNCTLCWNASAQTNNVEMNRPSFVNSGQFAQFANCEGVELNSPQFQNITDGSIGDSVTVRQSSVECINPYFENLNNASIALVGGSGDVIGSTLHILGGIAPGGTNVEYRENLRHNIIVEGVRTAGSGRVGIVCQSAQNQPVGYARLTGVNDDVTTLDGAPVQIYDIANQRYGGALFNQTVVGEQEAEYVSYPSGAFSHTISGLTEGAPYTVMIAMRRSATGNVTGRWRSGGTITETITMNRLFPFDTEEWEVKMMPFLARGDQWEIIFDDAAYQLQYFGLFEGHVFNRPFINNPAKAVRYSQAIPPSNTGWERGQVVFNESPLTGEPMGWYFNGSAWAALPALP